MLRLKSLDQSKIAVIAGILAVILFVAVNVLAGATLRSTQIDLTQNKLFTLSKGTKQVLQSIDEPITLRFYASRALAEGAPAYGHYIKRVRELLQHYADLSHGMIHLQIYNPQPYSVQEDQAVAYGLQGIQLDSNGGDTVYFGLAATNSTDDQQVIPFFNTQREPYLEYDITRLLFNLAHPKKKVVGLLSFLPIDADPLKQYKPWAVLDQLKQFVTVRPIGPHVTRIPDNIDLLMIVQPEHLNDKALYAIDQFVLRGGRALIFVDPHSEAQAEMAAAMRRPAGNTSSDLHKLFQTWGIEYSPKTFVGDRDAASRVQVSEQGRPVVTDYVSWLNLGPKNFDSKDVTTCDLHRIFMAAAGSLSKKKGADITFTPLIQSSENSMLIDASKVRTKPDPLQLLRNFKSAAHSFTLAARISGRLKTAFPNGAPKDENAGQKAKSGKDQKADVKPQPKQLMESKGPVNMIIVADTDMLADRAWLQFQNFFGRKVAVPTANNAAFVVNAVDNLLGSNALINLRSRGLSTHPFYRIKALKRAAQDRYSRTEQMLLDRLQKTKAELGKLNTKGNSGEAILTASQRKTVRKFRADLVTTREQLREVQHDLRKDIDALYTWLEILNIWAVPLAVCLVAIVVAWVRRRKYRVSAPTEKSA